jgi:hypothetical protein
MSSSRDVGETNRFKPPAPAAKNFNAVQPIKFRAA